MLLSMRNKGGKKRKKRCIFKNGFTAFAAQTKQEPGKILEVGDGGKSEIKCMNEINSGAKAR